MLIAAAAPAAIVTPAPDGVPWGASGIARLRAELDALLAKAPGVRGAHVGVLAIDAATGTTLYSHNAEDHFQPASTLKLLVGSAALERLGPEYRFHTSIERVTMGESRPGVLVAGGDPFLDARDLDAAVAAIDAGGERLAGLYVDDSRYDERPYPEGWSWDDFPQDYAARVSAATFEENVLHVTVEPGDRVGDAARIKTAPIYKSRQGPAPAPCASRPDVFAAATTGPPGSESTIDVDRTQTGCNEVIGTIPLDSPGESIDVAVQCPADYLLEYLYGAYLHGGRPASTFVPYRSVPDAAVCAGGIPPYAAGADLWSHDSPPLREWLGPRFWIPSDNLVAETLLKELGFVTGGKPGTTEKGIAFEEKWLRRIGVDPATTTLADGSGLSQYDRITPRDLVAILQHDWNGPDRDLILASLPVGGARGTIEGIAGTAVAGRVFAKTGSMSHVRGLAGYLAPLHHGAVIFAFSVDDWIGDYPALAALRAAVLSRIVRD